MIIGKVKTKDGEDADIVVGAGDGGVVPVNDMYKGEHPGGVANSNFGPSTTPSVVGFGNATPPSYASSDIGEPLGGQGLQGQSYPPEKGPQWR